MKGVNKAILIGTLGRDPKVSATKIGNTVAAVSVATSESWKDKNTGQQQEKTEWHRVVFFGRLAEVAGQYLKKGSKVYIEGKLTTREYVDTNGIKKHTTEINANQMQMLDSKQGGSAQQYAQASGGYQEQQRPAQQQVDDFEDESLPF